MKLSVQEPLSDIDGYFVYISRPMIDIISGLMSILVERRIYATQDDYERGYNLTALIKGCMLDCPAERLIHGQEALYRLIDRSVNGTVYTVVSESPLVVEPPIPAAPSLSYTLPGQIAQLELVNVTLQEIRDALVSEGVEPETVAKLLQIIAGLLA